jgi:putative membrane protein
MTTLRKTVACGVVLMTALAVMAQNTQTRESQDPKTSTPGATAGGGKDTSFIKEAAEGNAREIALAELATQKSQNSEVKTFAEHIRKDHTEANQKLQTIAQKHGVTISETPDAKQQRELDKFQKLSGAQFDQEYAKEMLKDHQKAIAKFEKVSKQSQDTDVKQYAEQCLPKLRTHLQHAQTVAKAVGVDQETISSLTKGTPGAVGGTGDEDKSQTGSEQEKKDTPKPRPDL